MKFKLSDAQLNTTMSATLKNPACPHTVHLLGEQLTSIIGQLKACGQITQSAVNNWEGLRNPEKVDKLLSYLDCQIAVESRPFYRSMKTEEVHHNFRTALQTLGLSYLLMEPEVSTGNLKIMTPQPKASQYFAQSAPRELYIEPSLGSCLAPFIEEDDVVHFIKDSIAKCTTPQRLLPLEQLAKILGLKDPQKEIVGLWAKREFFDAWLWFLSSVPDHDTIFTFSQKANLEKVCSSHQRAIEKTPIERWFSPELETYFASNPAQGSLVCEMLMENNVISYDDYKTVMATYPKVFFSMIKQRPACKILYAMKSLSLPPHINDLFPLSNQELCRRLIGATKVSCNPAPAASPKPVPWEEELITKALPNIDQTTRDKYVETLKSSGFDDIEDLQRAQRRRPSKG